MSKTNRGVKDSSNDNDETKPDNPRTPQHVQVDKLDTTSHVSLIIIMMINSTDVLLALMLNVQGLCYLLADMMKPYFNISDISK